MVEERLQEWSTQAGALAYVTEAGKARVTAYRGADALLAVPHLLGNCPVTHIGKKAFLGNRALREISLPPSLLGIGDWAFACCAGLRQVSLPYRPLETGQGIFKDCPGLLRIQDSGGAGQEGRAEDVSWLLAAAMTKLFAFYLFDLEAAGSPEWLARWDQRMLAFLGAADEEGFSKMLLCGEEDYGSKENNLDHYTGQRRRQKVRLAMLRLMHDVDLAEELREALLSYLLAHGKGKESEETWRVVFEEHGGELPYYRFLADIGAANRENLQAMLADMGAAQPEMKAYLLQRCGGAGEDPFAAFAL